MSARHLPVRPDLDQLKHQAKDLLRAFRAGDPSAIADFAEYHPDRPEPGAAKLADAQLVLARSYEARSWPRLVLACKLIDAIWDDDIDTVRELVRQHPQLIHENTGIREHYNWGRPMSYAANLGRDRIIAMLHAMGATDLEFAIDRAALQGQIGTARMLHALGAPVPRDALGGPAYTLNAAGTALMLELGARVVDDAGRCVAPVAVVLETDSRRPDAKHKILEMYAQHGCSLPDTPLMAFHRGRLDLLDEHLRRDPALLTRTFTFADIFPPDLGCQGEQFPRTSLEGATLLHLAVEFDELEITRWLLERGMSADARAAVDADGFGGHTPLFQAVVSYANFWINYRGGRAAPEPADSPLTRLFLDHGADPNARASLRELVMEDYRPIGVRKHRNITPIGWGHAFHDARIVSQPAMHLIAAHGGHE